MSILEVLIICEAVVSEAVKDLKFRTNDLPHVGGTGA